MCNLCGDSSHIAGTPLVFSDTFSDQAVAPTSGLVEGSGAGADDRSEASAIGQGATGNNYIDGLLIGTRWNGAFTYSFPQLSTDYPAGYSGENTTNFAPVTFQQREATRAALNGQTFSGTVNVMRATNLASFIATGVGEAGGLGNGLNGAGDIRLGESTAANPTAYAYYPNNNANGNGGDAWFGTNYAGTSNDYRNPYMGGYAYHTLIHEIGHAMGLKHGHQTGGVSNVAVPADRDAIEYSVMTYRTYIGGPTNGYTYEQYGAPQTFMMYDILALQTMYGADYGAESNNGNTTYAWSPTTGETFINGVSQGTPGANRVFMTVWDGGGLDTYNLSNYTTNLTIDLRPGNYSTLSAAQKANLGAGQFAHGNVYNALLFGGNTASLIENAIGGTGSDAIYGNQATNYIFGGDGGDSIVGNEGADQLAGQGGSDYIYGGSEGDAISGGDGGDNLSGDAGSDYILGEAGGDAIAGGAGGDVLDGGDGDDIMWGHDPSGAGDLADLINGGNGNDLIIGHDGADQLYGGAGQDTIAGGNGGDVLYGEAGNDNLYGNADGDAFVFNTINFGADNIWDFTPGSDKIYMSTAIFANFAEVQASAVGGPGVTVITDAGGLGQIALQGFGVGALNAADWVFF